jgi:uncharacterized protein
MMKFCSRHTRMTLVALALRRPFMVLAAAGLTAALSLFVAGSRLEFHADRSDLISAGDHFKQLDEQAKREFEALPDGVVVVIRSENPETAKAFATALGERWERDPKIETVLYRINLDGLKNKGLLFLSPDDLTALRQKLETRQDLLRDLAASPTLENVFTLIDREMTSTMVSRLFTGELDEGETEEEPIDFTPLLSLLRSVNQWLGGSRSFLPPWDSLAAGSSPGAAHDGYLWSDDKQLLFVLANPRTGAGNSDRLDKAVQEIRDEVKVLQRAYPGLQVGVTGRAALEADEKAVAMRDMAIAAVISTVGVVLLFVVFFRGLVRPALAGITLAVGMSWTLGFATLTVGHLNILTIAFLPALICLGGHSVHFLTRYEDERAAGGSVRLALEKTMAGTGGAILAAALAVACGFFLFLPTGFTGLMELGFLSGGGILLATLATFTLLPALLVVSEGRRGEETVPTRRRQDETRVQYLPWIHRHPRAVLAACGLLVGLSALGLARVRSDFNLLHLQTPGTESATWMQKILDSSKRSVLFEEVVAGSLDEVKRKAAALKALPEVAGVESIASVIPEDQPRKLELVRDLRPLIADVSFQTVPTASVDVRALQTTLGRIKFKMGDDADTPTPGDAEQFGAERREVRRLIGAIIEATGQMRPVEAQQALASYQEELVGDLRAKLGLLQKNLAATPLTVDDLPSELRARYVGRTGQYRLFVYPAGDIWEFGSLGRFARAVQSVDPDAHGTPVTIFEFLRQMTEGYRMGALYAAAGVVLVALFMFRAVGPTLLALIPLAVGAAWMLGLMGLLDVPFNAAHLLFLPLIAGVGIHNGIHVVAQFREIEKRGGVPAGLPRHTGRAISLVSLTTIVGFGSLMISSQPGIHGAGLVVALGVGCVLVASLTALPGLLALLARRTAARPPVSVAVDMQVVRVLAKRPERVPAMATERSGSGHALSPTLAAAGRKEAA